MASEIRSIPTREIPEATDGNGANCAWLPTALAQLAAIRRLPKGWDSHGGDAPDARILEDADRLLKRLCKEPQGWLQPHVHPTRSGGVQFEWESATCYFEIEIASDRTQFYFHDPVAGIERTGMIPGNGAVAEIIGCLV